MSRSTKKAIHKDKASRKEDYWRVHRRVNRQIVKHFYTSCVHKTRGYKVLPEYDYFDNLEKFLNQGYDEIVAHYMAHDLMDHIGWTYYKMAGNCFQDQGAEPLVKHPKELINDYDYSDWTWDYEYTLRYNYYTWYDYRTGKFKNDFKDHEDYVIKLRRK